MTIGLQLPQGNSNHLVARFVHFQIGVFIWLTCLVLPRIEDLGYSPNFGCLIREH